MTEITRNCYKHTRSVKRSHFGIFNVANRQASIFLRQLHVSNILCVRRLYLAHAQVFTSTVG